MVCIGGIIACLYTHEFKRLIILYLGMCHGCFLQLPLALCFWQALLHGTPILLEGIFQRGNCLLTLIGNFIQVSLTMVYSVACVQFSSFWWPLQTGNLSREALSFLRTETLLDGFVSFLWQSFSF